MAAHDSGSWGRLDESNVESRRQCQIVSAIARTAANLASRASLESLLAAIAEELLEIDGIAAAQLILVERRSGALRMMGASGFSRDPGFLELLEECHRRGAPLATYAALNAHGQLIYRDRKSAMLADASWEPLHDYIMQRDWNEFVATPFSPQGGDQDVVNCYLEPGFEADSQLSQFLLSMADQAALAVDYHDLIESARTSERQRIARDLHDSVIQNVFSIGMQARALESIGGALGASGTTVAVIARDLQTLAQQVQADLRGIVRALQPSPAAERGLQTALRQLADAVTARSHVPIDVSVSGLGDALRVDMIDDLYFIVSEATHNAVKHSRCTRVDISVSFANGREASVRVSDDGVGLSSDAVPSGYGLASMRYRAARWHGTLDIMSGRDGVGTVISTELSDPQGHQQGLKTDD